MYNDLTKELGQNFIDYAYAVNTDRAIPDAKTGLKPVARRILWSMFEEGRLFNKPHVKAARITGDVMGRYHPHGDSSIYGAMVRLSQLWVMRYPLIDWHGNNGNIAGDGPAAARYTEARLSKVSEEGLLVGIKKNNVDFMPNYDETLEEPVTLPSVFPNLLCNPNTGIGVAMACNWAPHNLREVADMLVNYIEGKDVTLPGPDFPTGGLIINKDDIPKIMATGKGSVKIRARYKVEKNKIIFYEIPYGTTIEGLINEVGTLAEKKEIAGIDDIHDESGKKIRIVITCEKGADPESLVKLLYAKTNFQTSFSYNQVALIDKTPTELNLKDCCKIYLEHNLECLVRESQFDLDKALARDEIVIGLLNALEDIDNIINLIKKSESAAAAKVNLISKYEFTENQAKAILAMRLSSLAKLESVELNKEHEELVAKIDDLKSLINNETRQKDIIKDRLKSLAKKYGDDRRTELAQIEIPKETKEKVVEEIVPEDVVVIITKTNDIKRVLKKNFRVQNRRGVGVKSLDGVTLAAVSTNTTNTILVFSSTGKMYRLPVHKIPEGTNTSKGMNIKTLLPFEPNEMVQAVVDDNNDASYAVFFTKKGLIKKTNLSEYKSMKKTTGVQAIKIKDGDELVTVKMMEEEEVILVTKNGMLVRVPTDDIKPIGRLTSGVKGMGVKEGDEVISANPIWNTDAELAVVTIAGKGKRVPLKEFIIQNRGGRGVSCMKLDKGDHIAAAALASLDDSLLIVGKPNSICVKMKDWSKQSKAAAGTKIIERSVVQTLTRL